MRKGLPSKEKGIEKMKILLCKKCESRLAIAETESRRGETIRILYCVQCQYPPKEFEIVQEQ